MAIILLVDASKTIRQVVEMAFKGSGYELAAASTAADARAEVVRRSPAAILLSYRLPDASGLELLRELRSSTGGRTPIIVLGGSYAPFDEAQALSGGAAGVLIKPFKTADLLGALEQALGGAPRQPSLSTGAASASSASAGPSVGVTPTLPPQAPRVAPPSPPRVGAGPPPPPPPPPRQASAAPAAPASPQAAPAHAAPSASDATTLQAMRQVCRELLPAMLRDALQQLLRDGLEGRLRKYAEDRVDINLQERVREVAAAIVEEEIRRQLDR